MKEAKAVRDRYLKARQVHDLSELLEHLGFVIEEFVWKADKSQSHYAEDAQVPVLAHEASGCSFTFDFEFRSNRSIICYSPVLRPGQMGTIEIGQAPDWDATLRHFRTWLGCLTEELEYRKLDPWGTIGEALSKSAAGGGRAVSAALTREEKKAAGKRLDEFRKVLVKNHSPSPEALERIDENLSAVRSLLEEGTQVQVRLALLGLVANAVLTLAVNPVAARELFTMLLSSLRTIAG